LFNVPKGGDSQREKDIVLDNLALAQKELGLKLLGTVKANDDTLSLAIIHDRKTKEQKIYHEGDGDDNLLIKKILRNKVVIRTNNSDVLLAITPQDFRKKNKISTKPQKPTENFDHTQKKAAKTSGSSSKMKHIRLSRNQIESGLADLDALMQEVRISPYKRNKKPSGFIISNIPGGSILRKLGLRSRDVIKEVNGQKFSGPDEAVEFFQELATGGELTIKLRRKRRNRQMKLAIE
jgi:type II secretion system protein C